MKIDLLTDQEMYGRIYQGCRQRRFQLEMTQSDLARRAGLSLRTIKKFEAGDNINFRSLMKLLRALGEFKRLETLVIEAVESPKEIFFREKRTRPQPMRVRHAKN